jgi:hypothetical protein
MTYKEKLQLPEWKAKRQEILKRDDCKCQSCGHKSKSNHIHHSIYYPNLEPWDYCNHLLITLCKECHKKEEFLKAFDDNNLRYFFNLGILRIDLNKITQKLSQASDVVDDRLLAKLFLEHINNFKIFKQYGL